MTVINRRDLTSSLSRNGGYVEIDAMPAELRTALHDSGVTDHDLEQIAGQDRVIRGSSEWNALFTRLDGAERDRVAGALTVRDGSGAPTQVGRAIEALQAKVADNRARAAREGGQRFQGDAVLAEVAGGRRVLHAGDAGEHVRRVQQALADLGFLDPSAGVNGRFDAATDRAVERFQREVGLSLDGQVGAETLGALASCAPPPGQVLQRSAEYDRLFADGRLQVTVALGYDEHGTEPETERQVLSGLRRQGFHVVTGAEERTRLGITGDRYDPRALYFARTQHDARTDREVDVVVRLLTPAGDGADARASYERALRQDEVVIYAGHARYGTGPDFDPIDQGRGNFVVDSTGNRRADRPPAGLRASIGNDRSDLRALTDRPDYQLLVFNACTTEEYLHNLRNPSVFRASMTDTDVIATTIPTRLATSGEHVVRFLEGITRREPNNTMLRAQNAIEQSTLRGFELGELAAQAGYTYTESGFLGNGENRRVER